MWHPVTNLYSAGSWVHCPAKVSCPPRKTNIDHHLKILAHIGEQRKSMLVLMNTRYRFPKTGLRIVQPQSPSHKDVTCSGKVLLTMCAHPQKGRCGSNQPHLRNKLELIEHLHAISKALHFNQLVNVGKHSHAQTKRYCHQNLQNFEGLVTQATGVSLTAVLNFRRSEIDKSIFHNSAMPNMQLGPQSHKTLNVFLPCICWTCCCATIYSSSCQRLCVYSVWSTSRDKSLSSIDWGTTPSFDMPGATHLLGGHKLPKWGQQTCLSSLNPQMGLEGVPHRDFGPQLALLHPRRVCLPWCTPGVHGWPGQPQSTIVINFKCYLFVHLCNSSVFWLNSPPYPWSLAFTGEDEIIIETLNTIKTNVLICMQSSGRNPLVQGINEGSCLKYISGLQEWCDADRREQPVCFYFKPLTISKHSTFFVISYNSISAGFKKGEKQLLWQLWCELKDSAFPLKNLKVPSSGRNNDFFPAFDVNTGGTTSIFGFTAQHQSELSWSCWHSYTTSEKPEFLAVLVQLFSQLNQTYRHHIFGK